MTTAEDIARPKAIRNEALSGKEILQFSQNGFLRVGRVLNDERLEQVRLEVENFRKTKTEIDLLDPSQWELGVGGVPQEPGKTVSFFLTSG